MTPRNVNEITELDEKMDNMLEKANRLVKLLTEAKELIDSMGCTNVTNNFSTDGH